MKVYIAGPMTGIPQFNFPAFDDAARDLRKQGYEVVSPAELDRPEIRKLALASPDGDPSHYDSGESWGDFLSRDVKLIADEDIEGIFVLPGWEKSRGARLETFVARLCNIPIVRYGEGREISSSDFNRAHGMGSYGETIVTDPQTGGQKDVKPEAYSLLPWEQLDEVARLYHAGSRKYARDNWRKGYKWSYSFDSLIRHAREWWQGNEIDEETGCNHMSSVVFHALALMFFSQHRQDLDDRCPTS